MNDVRPADHRKQTPQEARRELADTGLSFVKHRIAAGRTIRCAHVDPVAKSGTGAVGRQNRQFDPVVFRQAIAQTIHRVDGSAVIGRRVEGRNDVENVHWSGEQYCLFHPVHTARVGLELTLELAKRTIGFIALYSELNRTLLPPGGIHKSRAFLRQPIHRKHPCPENNETIDHASNCQVQV